MLFIPIISIAVGLIVIFKVKRHRLIGRVLLAVGLIHLLVILAFIFRLFYVRQLMDLLFLVQFLMWLYVLFTGIQSIPGATRVVLICIGVILIIASGIIRSRDWQLTKCWELRALDTWTIIGFIIGALFVIAGIFYKSIFGGRDKERAPERVARKNIEIEIGQTEERVREALGDPDKILSLETETVYVYPDVKIVFEDGKISKINY